MSYVKPKEKTSPKDPYKEGMTDEEQKNYDTLKASDKKWNSDDARDMATNPSGRLPKVDQPKAKTKLQKLYPNTNSSSDSK